jgi:hypothetical protein
VLAANPQIEREPQKDEVVAAEALRTVCTLGEKGVRVGSEGVRASQAATFLTCLAENNAKQASS